MSDESPIESIPLTAQVVLLGVAELTREDETPVQTHDLRRHCQQQLPAVDTEVVGTITEADVIRSLYRLEDEDFVEEIDSAETSPTGKGRPAYTLAVSVETVYDGVADELHDAATD
ncbi:CBS domain-containing protein [Natrinema altunense]|uniref:Transcriptional regulator n=1 Tax=Natrinema altunense (strain JCM 12890 / CGMCC 1.3731 / AJ2) TaxID=1227494 RepID=L9ZXZ5_NATA2|nr:hypothetical protein [Natrinema altunense]ELY91189.1 hypothetical protein C485_02269 [Natrinema altunense JCM 12890]